MGNFYSWKKYNQDLVNRGNIGILLDKNLFLEARSTKRGRAYNDKYINAIFMIKAILNLQYRQLEGFMTYLIKDVMGMPNVDIPDYTTIEKRKKEIKITKRNHYDKTIFENKDIIGIMDSSGFSLFFKLDWLTYKDSLKNKKKNSKNNSKSNKYKESKAKFVKFHVFIDKDTGLCMSHTVTEASGNNTHDTTQYRPLLEKAEDYHGEIKENITDKAYDSEDNYKAAEEKNIKNICPVKDNVKNIDIHNFDREIARICRDNNDMKFWSKNTGYNFRGLVEAFFSKFKRIFSDRVRYKTMPNIKADFALKVEIINAYVMREIDIMTVPCTIKRISKMPLITSR